MQSLAERAHDNLIASIAELVRLSKTTYLDLPLGWRRFILDVAPFADTILFTLVGVLLMNSRWVVRCGACLCCSTGDVPPTTTKTHRVTDATRRVSVWTVASLTAAFAVVALVLFFLFLTMANAQAFTHHKNVLALGLDPEQHETENPFVPLLPVDLIFGWTQQNATDLVVALHPAAKSVGISAWQNYLYIDSLLAIPLYVAIHHNIVSYLYPDTTDQTAFFVNKLPFLMGLLDFYENIGHLIASYTFAEWSPEYLGRLNTANQAKYIAFFSLVGLELSGFVAKIGTSVSSEIKSSGLRATATDAEKKAEEKKKARLEKKGKKAE
ncbi:hypothetical protein BC830DRAFT_1085379 [Chytriomyces sp. MP71]|nr:hypothetical protein BC830DRAFT_1085379 [Chytriomyces sp. MP71]